MLAEVGLKREEILLTNLVAAHPLNDETWRFFVPAVEWGKRPRVRGLSPSEFVESELHRLYAQLASYPRDLVISAGNWSTWALANVTGSSILSSSRGRKIPKELKTWAPSGIMTWRGSMLYLEPIGEYTDPKDKSALHQVKLMPIIHPAAISREWYLRAPTINDLRRRVPQARIDDWRPNPRPTILAPPDFEDVINTIDTWLTTNTPLMIAADCETRVPHLVCFGFSDSPQFAISIPFIRVAEDLHFDSYWSLEQETKIIQRIRRLFTHPMIRIIGQNFIYDTQYAQHWWGVKPKLFWDTMLAQNVMFPGTPKDLSYLSSVYCQHHWHWKEDGKTWDLKSPLSQLLEYNAWDCLRTWEIAYNQQVLCNHIGMSPQMELKMKINEFCLKMMNRGMKVDKRRKDTLGHELREAGSAVETELLAIAPQDLVKPDADSMWYNSSQQKAFLLYDQLGMDVVKKKGTGQPTTGKEAFPILTRKYPEFTGLFERLRYYDKLDSSAEVLSMGIDPDGRVRCSFNPGGTDTHRLSSSTNAFGRGANLQNLTKGEEDD